MLQGTDTPGRKVELISATHLRCHPDDEIPAATVIEDALPLDLLLVKWITTIVCPTGTKHAYLG